MNSPIDVRGPSIALSVGPYRRSGRARDLFKVERAYLRQAMQAGKPDVVHAHWTYEFALAAIETGLPSLVTAHDAPLNVLKLMPDPYRLVRAFMALLVTRRANHLTAISPYLINHFKSWFRYAGDIPLIPNGFPDDLFALGDSRDRLPDDGTTFAAVINGGWSKLKNPEPLLRAFGMAREENQRIELHVFGTGWDRKGDAFRAAQRLSLDEGVNFEGPVPWPVLMEELRTRADVFVHPSREESFSNVLVEAMACSLPVIGGVSSGAVPYILDHGHAGVLVDVTSAEDIARAMLDLERDGSMRLEVASAGHRYARNQFHIDGVGRAYLDQYEGLLST